MPVNPVWLGLLLALPPGLVSAGPAPTGTPVPRPREPEGPQAVLLNGKPFPAVAPFAAPAPKPSRTVFVAAAGEKGDGSASHPWNDLQAALRALEPGDRLSVGAGNYTGPFRIDETCRDGSGRRPIQVVFDGKARIDPGGAEAAALTIRRAHWNLTGAFVDLGQSTGPGIALEAGAGDVTLNRSRISGGAGPGILVGGETDRIRIGNSRIAKSGLEKAQPEAVGIVIEAGARNTLIANNRLKENPGGSIRVRAPAAGGRAAGGLRLLGNTFRDDAATGIEVEAADGIRIASNTISDSPTWTGTRGIVLGRVNDAVVQWNHISDRGIGVQLGEAAAKGGVRQAAKVSIDNNYIADTFSAGTGVRIEAARDTRVVHNVLDRVAQAFLVLGAPPQTERVTVSNNLALGVAALAFALEDPKAAALFDHNVFSPSAGSLNARVGERETSLATFLKGKTMPYTKLVPGVRILNRDLARIEGVQTRDIGLKEQ